MLGGDNPNDDPNEEERFVVVPLCLELEDGRLVGDIRGWDIPQEGDGK
jgi:hypothetical protein